MAKKTSTVQPSTSNLQPAAPDAATIAAAIRQQVALVGEIELRGNFEKLKLGAMVSEAVKQLKLDGAQTGRGHAGDGALGWWNDVCPKNDAGETVIKYRTVMMWKAAAENLPSLMGLGVRRREEVVALLAENPAEAVGKDAKILASAERAANGMTMRQMLLWGGDEPKGTVGRPVGTGHEYKKKTAVECAVATVFPVVNHLLKHRGAMFTSYKVLPDHKLSELLETLEEHVSAIKDEMKRRG